MSDGHKATSLTPAAEAARPFCAGVDVGGTNMKIGLVDNEGRAVAFVSIPTEQEKGAEDAAGRAAEALERLCSQAGVRRDDVLRVGVATPGPMDVPAGRLHSPGNLPGWRLAPVRDLFAAATGRPVTFANDANAAAWGEFWRGAGAEYHSMVLITLGTGVGGGIVVGDQLVNGAHSAGGEIGHIIIDARDDAPLNSLEIRGTLEGYCGSYGVVGRAEAALADHFVESSLRHSVTGGEELTPLLIANAAEAGDELAQGVVRDTAKYLAIGVVSCAHMIDPECVAIGGGMTFGGAGHPLGDWFLDEVRNQARARLLNNLRDALVIDFAKLGGDAGFIGAAGLARRDAQAH